MATAEEVKEKLNGLLPGVDNEKEFADFVMNCESDIFNGYNSDGEAITTAIEKGVGVRISTYQNNGWIRINSYYLSFNEDGNPEVTETEEYEK